MPGFATIEQAAKALRRGETTSVALTGQCLQRIERFEPNVQAWVDVKADDSLAAADALDRELAAGHDRGLLHGIPIGVKDIIDVQTWRTRAGSPLRSHHVAEKNAAVVARLLGAGAVILGKTVTTEFASFDPSPTFNPWDATRTPGGSSSGSAAAVALGMCLGALATQTGGSITRPASYCGVCGIKPEYGELPLEGVVPLAPSLDHMGAMARSVVGLAAMVAGMRGEAGPDAELLMAASARLSASAEPPRMVVVEALYDHVSADMQRLMQQATERLQAAGAEIVPSPLPAEWKTVHARHRTIMAVEAAHYHRGDFAQHADQYGPRISELIAEGLATPAVAYVEALRHQHNFSRAIEETTLGFPKLQAWLLPATTDTAPARETTGDPYFNSPISHSGLPCVSLPCALASDGLPVAIQLVGRRGHTRKLLEAAAWCEKVLAFECLPPMARQRTAGL